MSMSRFAVLVLSLTISASFAQSPLAQSMSAGKTRFDSSLPAEGASVDQAKEPKLEHFDPNLVDKSLDPCNDFYKYSCSKWLAANPIPADQVYWSTGSGLEFWNENLLRETLEGASKNESQRSAGQQKIGDYCLHGRSRHRSLWPEADPAGTRSYCRPEIKERHYP
jgi:hypothetical protein